MKAILGSLMGIFMITAVITHIWTVIIAFSVGGFFAGVVSLFLPVLAEIYWMFSMFGENDLYAWTALVHSILAIPMTFLSRQ